ncbi:PAX3- and PAX7-binding protein 1 [Nymphon striatum]|nr:PAX3- and PAX7-binding protein 1 [Nymphon striatum]
MSLFKKPKRNFRQREINLNDSDNEEDSQYDSSKTDQKTEKKNKYNKLPTQHKKSSLLSFDHDEDEEDGNEVFKVKKSSVSRRLEKIKNKQKKHKEKQKSDYVENEIQDNSINLNFKSIKPVVKQSSDESTSNKDDIDYDSDIDDNEPSKPDDPVRKALECGAIPDAAMIHAARKQRQQARELGASSDFIALDEPQDNKDSRLIRDDDNDVSDEENQGRISFTVNTREKERAKLYEAFLESQKREQDQSDVEVGHDEEVERWEAEQIRKGVSIPQLQPDMHDSNEISIIENIITPYQSVLVNSHKNFGISIIDDHYQSQIAFKVPTEPLEKITTSMIKLRLQDRLETLKEVNRVHELEMDKLQDDMIESQTLINTLEGSGPDVANKFNFFQQMRGYVTDLVECLNEKVVVINALEERMHSLLSERANRFAKRRQQDCKDQAEEFSALLSKNITKPSNQDPEKQRRMAEREGRSDSDNSDVDYEPMESDNETIDSYESDDVDISEHEDDGVMLSGSWKRISDIFSDCRPNSLPELVRKSCTKLIRRRRNRESIIKIGQKHYDGLSSDDEEERTVVAMFNSSMSVILNDSELVFNDVNEEFSNLNEMKIMYEKWKRLYPETYSEAYISLCLPKLFGPYIRLELLSWNPLEQVRNIETMHWYNTLLTYGCSNDMSVDAEDPDLNLIPLVIEKVILPKLTDLIERVWDPMSTSQTLRLVNLIQRLGEDYPTLTDMSDPTKNLLKIIVGKMKKALENDVFVPLYPRQLLENRNFNGLSFFQRQLWSCVKLLKNILKWDGIISEQPLQELSINGLLNRYMILGLQNSPVNNEVLEKAKMISAAFPSSWFVISDEHSIPQLLMFCRFLKMTADYIGCEKSAFGTDIVSNRDCFKDIMKMLISIGDREQAQIISTQYSVF